MPADLLNTMDFAAFSRQAWRRRHWLLAGLPALAGAGALEVPLALGSSQSSPYGLRVARMMELAAQGAGWRWRYHFVPWPRALAMAERGEAIAFGASRTREREARLLFSAAVYSNQVHALVRRDEPLVGQGLSRLSGRRVCMRRGISYGDEFDALVRSQSISVELFDGHFEQGLRMLQGRRCEALTDSDTRGAARYWAELQASFGSAALEGLMVDPLPLAEEGIHFVVARGHALAQHMSRLDAGLRQQREAIRHIWEAD